MIAELRYVVRSLARERGFALGVIATFAVAIGATAAMFGLVNRLMLAPPPGVADARQVMRVQYAYGEPSGDRFTLTTTSYPVFETVSGVDGAFASVAAERTDTVTIGSGAELARVPVVQASGRYFSTLGVRPAAGRFFGPGDDVLPAGNDVVVLGYAFWQRQFNGEMSVLGTELVVDGQWLTVIGVAPSEFNGTALGTTDLYVPLSTAMRARGAGWWSQTGFNLVTVVVRLREGVEPTAASEMVAAALRESGSAGSRETLVAAALESLHPGRSARGTPHGRIALWATGVALAVLLIATANVGTLLLLRAARRRGMTAVRIALGARPMALVGHSLLEGLLLALVGAGIGVLLSRWFSDAIRATLLPGLAPDGGIVDSRVLLASIVAACVAGLAAGLGPLAQYGRRNLTVDLRASGGHGASGRFVLQQGLVMLQVGLCIVLLIGAGLFVRSVRRVQGQDLGFSAARLLHITLDFRGALSGPGRDEAHFAAVDRIRAVPGITNASVTQGTPFASHHIPPISLPGYELPPPNLKQLPILYGATPDYLAMMGVRAREGRLFTEGDTRTSPLVVLVNETMARTAWPGQGAIGRCVKVGYGPTMDDDHMVAVQQLPCRTAVGVVRDSRARSLRTEGDEAALMQYYLPFAQVPQPPLGNVNEVHAIIAQSAGDPGAVVADVQRIIQGTSATPVYAHVVPYQELLDPQLRSWRLGAALFSAFGALALVIAAVGLFAVTSYVVSQRTQEIGVRLALGGSARTVATLVVRDAVRLTAIGGTAGMVVALVGAPLVQDLLFQTSPRDAMSVLVAGLGLLSVTIAAAALPAWRAGRVSPMIALRND
ncbi:MAG: ABC transporter permease [Cytophagaceae bacterium]|nr:ABC transporter permease [Gemmatimonadaceae bacterium]